MDKKKEAEIKQSIDEVVLRLNHKALDVYIKLLYRVGVRDCKVDVRPFFP